MKSEVSGNHEIIGDVRGRGLLIGMERVKDKKSKEYAPPHALLILEQCKKRGLLVGKGGLYGNLIVIQQRP
jgi:4-aminobutyrate aminotransferase-like enzyme